MRNWKLITDGDIFEAIVGSLLQADIPGIIVFGRHGPDSGSGIRGLSPQGAQGRGRPCYAT